MYVYIHLRMYVFNIHVWLLVYFNLSPYICIVNTYVFFLLLSVLFSLLNKILNSIFELSLSVFVYG